MEEKIKVPNLKPQTLIKAVNKPQTLIKAVKQTRRMWESILWSIQERDTRCTDIGVLKDRYCAKLEVDWLFACPLCEVVIGKYVTSNIDQEEFCRGCPLIECWTLGGTIELPPNKAPCCNYKSPYSKVRGLLKGGKPQEAMIECMVILWHCDDYLNRWEKTYTNKGKKTYAPSRTYWLEKQGKIIK